MTKSTYSPISDRSNHGEFTVEFSEANEDESLVLSTSPIRKGTLFDCCSSLGLILSSLTFSWMRPLLKLGNERPLVQEDLHGLTAVDKSSGVYSIFMKHWSKEIRNFNFHSDRDSVSDSQTSCKPSLARTYILSFGIPFMAAGFLKLIHDSCLFVGPVLLNHLIFFLRDPSKPFSLGLSYVFGLFIANFAMSLCLRQYFWWCYRVGMWLRSAVVTSVFQKSLVLSSGIEILCI